MIIFVFYVLSITFSLLILNLLFLAYLINHDNYISNQLKYFICKVMLLAVITYFFCFIFPLNSIKFILSGLAIFITFHFTEALVIQKRINMRDLNE